ncbi:MAG TPA: putative quinol monooxygenase [Roseiarcus sp.]|nr:putative quinol monooxygenase [Roseiarcus sp.]
MSEKHIRAIAHLGARPNKTEELGALLTSLLAPTRKEQGCVRFELQQNRDAPTEFAIVSEWRGEDAVRHHIATGYAQHALRRLPELLTAPLDLRFYRCVG